jgi:hypothetical protein
MASMNPNDADSWADAATNCGCGFFGGTSGWRLPTAREYNTVVDYRTGKVFEALFGESNTGAIEVTWTSTPCGGQAVAFDPVYSPQSFIHANPTDQYLVRCVKGEWTGALEVSGGVITDGQARLVWTALAEPPGLSWGGALEHCEALTLDGMDDWRLPTIRELMDGAYAGAVGSPGVEGQGYWSSTPLYSGGSVWVAVRDMCFPLTEGRTPSGTDSMWTVCVRSTCGNACPDGLCLNGICQ